ncbi:MAG TPA: NfeD family protein [Acidimicrobiia bacterium]|nr:NfeD family protein [Acidimicrobiia bacterium]
MRVLAAALVFTAAAVGILDATAGATAPGAAAGRKGIDVVEVGGLLDPPTASLVVDAIRNANRTGATMLVVRLDSRGAVDVDAVAIARAMLESKVPIVAWVGPSGAQAKGAATLLLEAATVAFVAPGSSVGPAAPVRLDEPDTIPNRLVPPLLTGLATLGDREAAGVRRLATHELSANDAFRAHAVDGIRPTIGEVIVTLDGKSVRTAAGKVELSTAKVIGHGTGRRRQPNQNVVFDSLSLGQRVQHALISPSLAYFLLLAGLGLIVFEFFACSVGFAGAVGALATIGACYGFSHLPMRWWAVALLVVAVFGLSIDVQAGGLGAWTIIGSACLVAGSLTLYGGVDLNPAWWLILIVCIVIAGFFLFALPAFVRARFSTPTVGREGMIGELGTAEVPVDPDGVVMIRGARWRARTNRATPIGSGDSVRVVAVEGLVLEVEPEAGGARDYRDRARHRPSGNGSAPDGSDGAGDSTESGS